MKGIAGLVVAAILGVLAMSLNWLYLNEKSKDSQGMQFIAVRDGKTIEIGDVIQKTDLMPITIPKGNAKYLIESAISYENIGSAVNVRAIRQMNAGDIVLRQDYRTPAANLNLGAGKGLLWIDVDSRTFVPSLLNPGDEILFLVSNVARPAPLSEDDEELRASADATPVKADFDERMESIGPFTIVALGNRLGRRNVMQANRVPQVQERSIAIKINVTAKKMDDPQATKLLDRINRSKRGGVNVVLLQRGEAK